MYLIVIHTYSYLFIPIHTYVIHTYVSHCYSYLLLFIVIQSVDGGNEQAIYSENGIIPYTFSLGRWEQWN